jgi:HD superfamily phosphodiesterase
MVKCPGQDQRFWKPGDIFEIKCTNCGASMEFWKDEPRRKCPSCGVRVNNPKIDLGCAKWCQYAEHCLAAYGQDTNDIICQKLAAEMRDVFGDDQRRIDHALGVLSYADRIQQAEGGDPLVVKAAAILHDIGIHKAEEVHGSAAGKYQEMQGPPIARDIMVRLKLDKAVMDHVAKIIANHHSARDIDTTEFRILWDADWLMNIPDEFGDADKSELSGKIEKIFKTETGKSLAMKLFVE